LVLLDVSAVVRYDDDDDVIGVVDCILDEAEA